MNTQVLTRHGATRMQQRAIPPIVADWLNEFGEEQFDGHGGVVRYFSRASKRRLEQAIGRRFVRQNARYLDRYLVLSTADGAVITAGVLTRSIHRR
jgi:hypothetical protein